MTQPIHIVGAGMAGSEAAWQAARAGVPVILHEMRPQVGTFAHRTGDCAEMVCSNSFRSDDDVNNAVGQLHWEMRAAGGLIMTAADRHKLPAGGALAVDRDPFSADVTAALRAHPLVTIEEGEAHQFIAALNDMRLYASADDSGSEAARENRRTLIDWLAYCQDSLLQALMD